MFVVFFRLFHSTTGWLTAIFTVLFSEYSYNLEYSCNFEYLCDFGTVNGDI